MGDFSPDPGDQIGAGVVPDDDGEPGDAADHDTIMTPCIEFVGAVTSGGYGQRKLDGRRYAAHRLAYIAAYGCVPDGMHVLHCCDNRRCVNPEHLFIGTNLDNVQDKVAKGRVVTRRGQENGNAKLSTAQVKEMRRRHAAGEGSLSALARDFGCSHTQVKNIVTLRQRRTG